MAFLFWCGHKISAQWLSQFISFPELLLSSILWISFLCKSHVVERFVCTLPQTQHADFSIDHHIVSPGLKISWYCFPATHYMEPLSTEARKVNLTKVAKKQTLKLWATLSNWLTFIFVHGISDSLIMIQFSVLMYNILIKSVVLFLSPRIRSRNAAVNGGT